jgi:hypothetical protein
MVMNDQEFEQLSIAASICPSSDSWTGEHAHWQRLRACASEAQQREQSLQANGRDRSQRRSFPR